MKDVSDEELLAAIAAGPGALAEFYVRHVAKVTGMGVRRFDNAADVADFVATVFLEVLRSAGGFDPRRGDAVGWLYGLASNVAGGMYRQRARAARAEQQLSGRAFLDADDYARVEERIDAAAERRRAYAAMQDLDGRPIESFDPTRVSAIWVRAVDAQGNTVAHGVTSPDWIS